MKCLIMIPMAAWLCGCISPVPSNHFKGALGGVPFEFDTKKQTTAKQVELTVLSSTGTATNYATLKIGEISGVNDPQVIDKSYAGQAAVAKEYLDGLNNLASKLVEGGAKGAKGGL